MNLIPHRNSVRNQTQTISFSPQKKATTSTETPEVADTVTTSAAEQASPEAQDLRALSLSQKKRFLPNIDLRKTAKSVLFGGISAIPGAGAIVNMACIAEGSGGAGLAGFVANAAGTGILIKALVTGGSLALGGGVLAGAGIAGVCAWHSMSNWHRNDPQFR